MLVEDAVFIIAVAVVTVNGVPVDLVVSLDSGDSVYSVEATVVLLLTWLVLTNVTPLLPDCETINDLLDTFTFDKIGDWV